MIPERIKPDPIPEIRPVWEYQADGALVDIYEAYKRAFQVPWVGVVSMAFAHYEHFFGLWWNSFEAVVECTAYVEACEALRRQVEELVCSLNPPPIAERLTTLGYSAREVADIRAMIEVFSHGNFIQLPAVAAARLLLEGGSISGSQPLEPYALRHGPQGDTPFVLLEPHHALEDMRKVYMDIKQRLNLPFVNTDYRALARWPSYFTLAWGDLRNVLGSSEYEAIAKQMHAAVFEAARALPNPNGVTALQMQEAALRDARISEVLEVTRLFTYLLPGLVTNVAYFRAQFEPPA